MNKELLLQKSKLQNKQFIHSIINKVDIKDGETIAVAFWVTPAIYAEVKKMYPHSKVVLIEDISCKVYDILETIYVDLDKGEYWPDMKFDKVIMNPPYEKNLHLKVLEEVMEHISNDGKVINLSPIRWLQDPVASKKKNSDYNKYEKNISKHIQSLKEISAYDAERYFNAEMIMDLGIYELTKNDGKFNYVEFNTNTIVSKVTSLMNTSLFDKIEKNKLSGWRVRLSAIRPIPYNFFNNVTAKGMLYETTHPYFSWVYNNGYTETGKHWSENIHHKAGPKQFTKEDSLPLSIKFESRNEAINFENSTKTTFYRYLVLTIKTDQNFPLKYLPYMGDYTQPWTNERFYEYFNITKEEQKIIEETMKQYE